MIVQPSEQGSIRQCRRDTLGSRITTSHTASSRPIVIGPLSSRLSPSNASLRIVRNAIDDTSRATTTNQYDVAAPLACESLLISRPRTRPARAVCDACNAGAVRVDEL